MEATYKYDIRKFKISLVGSGYTYEDVKNMTDEEAQEIFTSIVNGAFKGEYERSVELIKDVLGKDELSEEDLLYKEG